MPGAQRVLGVRRGSSSLLRVQMENLVEDDRTRFCSLLAGSAAGMRALHLLSFLDDIKSYHVKVRSRRASQANGCKPALLTAQPLMLCCVARVPGCPFPIVLPARCCKRSLRTCATPPRGMSEQSPAREPPCALPMQRPPCRWWRSWCGARLC